MLSGLMFDRKLWMEVSAKTDLCIYYVSYFFHRTYSPWLACSLIFQIESSIHWSSFQPGACLSWCLFFVSLSFNISPLWNQITYLICCVMVTKHFWNNLCVKIITKTESPDAIGLLATNRIPHLHLIQIKCLLLLFHIQFIAWSLILIKL